MSVPARPRSPAETLPGISDKVAIVTGGANGIGRACLDAFVAAGANVVIADMDPSVTALARELGPRVDALVGDMRQETFCLRLAAHAVERFGRLDFLINNAFSFVAQGLDARRAAWLESMEAGPIAFATMCQAAAPEMAKVGGGVIVNVSSISAHIAQPGRWTYNAAKGAVSQITRCAALDLARWNIRVNAVSPGWIWTRQVEIAAAGDRARWEPVWGKFHMLRRLGRAEEVAHAVLFLCSNLASFITAVDLPVDGGYLGLGSEGLGENSEYPGKDG